jgi:hypothetical protein
LYIIFFDLIRIPRIIFIKIPPVYSFDDAPRLILKQTDLQGVRRHLAAAHHLLCFGVDWCQAFLRLPVLLRAWVLKRHAKHLTNQKLVYFDVKDHLNIVLRVEIRESVHCRSVLESGLKHVTHTYQFEVLEICGLRIWGVTNWLFVFVMDHLDAWRQNISGIV